MRSGSGGSAVAVSAGGRRANGRPPRGLGQRTRWERWRDPCGKLAGSFGDGSRTIRGGFEGRLAAEAPSGQAGGPARARSLARGESARWGSWPDPSVDGSRTIRGRFEDDSRWVRGAPGGGSAVRPGRRPREGAEPGEGRERPVGKLAGSFRGRFENDSRTIRGGFEGRLVAEAPSGQAGGPRDGAEPGEGRERPVGTVAGSSGDGSRTIRGRFEVGSRGAWRRKRRQARPAAPAMAWSRARGESARWGSWPDPSVDGSRTIRGRFEDDSRWVRGAPGGGSAVRPGRRPREGAEPGEGRERPVGKLAGSFRGRFENDSGTVRGRFEVGSRGAWWRKRRQARPAAPAMARSLARDESARWGRWPDPSVDGSRTIRGRFENDSRTF